MAASPPPPQPASASTTAIGDNCRRMRPVIGITAYAERARFGAWDVPTAFVPLSYVRAVERAGGQALLLPPCEEGIPETLDALDGHVHMDCHDLHPALIRTGPP